MAVNTGNGPHRAVGSSLALPGNRRARSAIVPEQWQISQALGEVCSTRCLADARPRSSSPVQGGLACGRNVPARPSDRLTCRIQAAFQNLQDDQAGIHPVPALATVWTADSA